ncbi:hypothetical protein [Vulcanisaeta sp. JCM 16161]|nr:hypothetical protein [Vulcanisaeta sp. JCM 16161]
MPSYQRWVGWLDEAEDDLATAIDLLRLSRYSKAATLLSRPLRRRLRPF